MSDFRRIHFGKKGKIEEQIRAQIQKDAKIPDQVYKSAENAYRMILEGAVRQERLEEKANAEHVSKSLSTACRRTGEGALHDNRKKVSPLLHRLAYGMAAVLAVCVLAGAAFPMQVRALPVVGSIFERIQKAVGYEHLSEYAKPLTGDGEPDEADSDAEGHKNTGTKDRTEPDAENVPGAGTKNRTEPDAENVPGAGTKDRTDSATQGYTQTNGDMTVSVSEVYADPEVIYLSMMFKSREPFPKSFYYSGGDEKIDGKVAMTLYANKKYSFMKDVDMEFWCGRNIETIVEGLMVNENTYEFLWRIDLANDLGQYRRNVDKDAAVPEEFSLDIEIDQIDSLRSMEKSYFGPWNFKIPVQVDDSSRETMEVHETGETGAGLISVEKTPFEITTRAVKPAKAGYKVVVLDAKGNKLPNVLQNEFWSDQAADEMREKWRIEGHDVSSVEVFVLGKDFYENVYSTGIWSRADWEGNEKKPKEEKLGTLLKQYAEYHKVIRFGS